MARITVNATYMQSDYGYIIGCIIVTDDEDKQLMYDEDMYWNESKFWSHVKKMFVDNKRFSVIGKPTYHKAEQRLEIVAEDLKGAK